MTIINKGQDSGRHTLCRVGLVRHACSSRLQHLPARRQGQRQATSRHLSILSADT